MVKISGKQILFGKHLQALRKLHRGVTWFAGRRMLTKIVSELEPQVRDLTELYQNAFAKWGEEVAPGQFRVRKDGLGEDEFRKFDSTIKGLMDSEVVVESVDAPIKIRVTSRALMDLDLDEELSLGGLIDLEEDDDEDIMEKLKGAEDAAREWKSKYDAIKKQLDDEQNRNKDGG